MARPRIPTELKIIAGTAQNCRLNQNEPKPERAIPAPPEYLGPLATGTWDLASSIADNMGVLTVADGIALELLAQALADYRKAHVSLSQPMYFEDAEGVVHTLAKANERYYYPYGTTMRRPRPELGDIADLDRRITALVTKFGMTPADRSRVSAAPAKDINPFSDLDNE